MTRPRGEVRMALRDTYALMPEPVTWRTVAEVAQVGYQVAQRTVENMARSGELRLVGKQGMAGLYQLASGHASAPSHAQDSVRSLVDAMRSWTEFV